MISQCIYFFFVFFNHSSLFVFTVPNIELAVGVPVSSGKINVTISGMLTLLFTSYFMNFFSENINFFVISTHVIFFQKGTNLGDNTETVLVIVMGRMCENLSILVPHQAITCLTTSHTLHNREHVYVVISQQLFKLHLQGI